MLRRPLLAAISLLAPVTVFAAQTTTWSFTDKQVPGQWDVGGFETAEPEAEGLHITGTKGGQIIGLNTTTAPIDVLEITVVSAQPTEANLLWHRTDNDDQKTLVQLPLSFAAGTDTVTVDMSYYPQWDPFADRLGLAMPPGTDLLLQQITFYSYSPFEKVKQGIRSFWKFDQVWPYSINFLWGPVITTTPPGTEVLFTEEGPPRGWSFNRILLPFLAMVGLACLLWRFLQPADRRKALCIFNSIAAVCWILFDARMGAELLSYTRTDYQNYLLQPLEQRNFRHFGNMSDELVQHRAVLAQEADYALLTPPATPYAAFLRYWLYPTLPVINDAIAKHPPGIRNWLVLQRDDVDVQNGHVTVRGYPVTGTGTVIVKFNRDHSFLFRTNE